MRTIRVALPLFLVGALAVACSDQTMPMESPVDGPAFSMGPVIHGASMGGADFCEALGLPTGCDGNFSLIAQEFADGSVKGQWEDSFGVGGGIHVAVDCVIVYGNQAVVGGVITHATGNAEGAVGARALMSVADNGTSAKDTPDQLSPSFFPFPPGVDCATYPPEVFPLLDLANGQVRVW
jgi:hypothetical protein